MKAGSPSVPRYLGDPRDQPQTTGIYDPAKHPPAGDPAFIVYFSPVVCMGPAGSSYTQMIFMGPRSIGELPIGAW